MPQEYESTNTDRLDFFFLNLVGHIVSVYTTDGCVTEGLFVSRSDDDSNAEPMILLSKARNRQSKAGGPLQATTVTSMLKIRLSDVVHLEANAVRVEAAAAGRVEPFKQVNLSEMNWAEMPLEDEGTLNSLEEEEKAWVPGKWDQFAANAQKFGVKSTYSEEQYTTRLDRSKFSKEEVELADRLSREIERTGTRGIQHRIERGEDVEVDEGTLYSDVQRQQQQQPTMSECSGTRNWISKPSEADADTQLRLPPVEDAAERPAEVLPCNSLKNVPRGHGTARQRNLLFHMASVLDRIVSDTRRCSPDWPGDGEYYDVEDSDYRAQAVTQHLQMHRVPFENNDNQQGGVLPVGTFSSGTKVSGGHSRQAGATKSSSSQPQQPVAAASPLLAPAVEDDASTSVRRQPTVLLRGGKSSHTSSSRGGSGGGGQHQNGSGSSYPSSKHHGMPSDSDR